MENNNIYESSPRLNPLNDYLFYKVMGEKGDELQLLGFLNAVLGHSGKEPIKSVEILENKAFVANIKNGKSCILDVRAVLADGTIVNVEVQLRNEYNIDRRSMFYWSRMYSESLNRGQNYRELPNVIAINVVDFDFPSGGKVHSCFHLREDFDPSLILTDTLEIHFINMVRWRKQAEKDIVKNPLHRWLVWLDAKSPPELVEEVAKMDRAIMAANEKQEYLTQDWEERSLYTRRLMAIMDYNSGMDHALREGRQEGEKIGEQKGRQEGEKIGKKEKALEIARKALAEGASVEFVQKITGLDIAAIQGLSS
jgi:predicted transposase/invertase (TIGR01784 family)